MITSNDIEFNSKCAEFLGWFYDPNMSEAADEACYLSERFLSGIYISDMKFHSDWDWIMEVVKKIKSLGYQYTYTSGLGLTTVSITNIPKNAEIVEIEESILIQASSKNSEMKPVIQAIDKFIKSFNHG